MKRSRLPVMVAISGFAALFLFSCSSGTPDRPDTAVPQAGSAAPADQEPAVASLTEYRSTTCGICEEVQHIFTSIQPAYAGVLAVRIVNLNQNREVVKDLRPAGFANRVPFIVLRSAAGEVLWTHTGYIPETELKDILADNGFTPAR
ncbi:MAG: hypothetical protein JW909_13695 [Planctomycetes bacterium]|nr:hypothetical protein [Planctomycetota bacterium]